MGTFMRWRSAGRICISGEISLKPGLSLTGRTLIGWPSGMAAFGVPSKEERMARFAPCWLMGAICMLPEISFKSSAGPLIISRDGKTVVVIGYLSALALA